MRHEDDRLARLCHIFQSSHEISLGSGIQAGSRLIKKEELWIREQFNCNAGSLFLTAAEPSDHSVCLTGQFNHIDHFAYSSFSLRGARIIGQSQFRCIIQHGKECQIVIHDILLRHISYNAFQRFIRIFFVKILSVNYNFAGRRFIISADRVHQSCFSRTGSSDDSNEFSRSYFQTDIITDIDRIISGFDSLYDVRYRYSDSSGISMEINKAGGIYHLGVGD